MPPARHARSGALDVLAVRVVAIVRVAAALGVAATGSFVASPSSEYDTLYLVAGLVWLPVAGVVVLASDRDRFLPVMLGAFGDGVMLVAMENLVPSAGEAALMGLAGVTAFVAYTGGRQVGTMFLACASLLTLVVQERLPAAERLSPTSLVLFALTGLSLVVLLDRTATIRGRMAARSARIESKADAILARVADAVVVTDAAGQILQVNPAAERLIGASEGEAVGRHCAAVLGLRQGERVIDCSSGCGLLALGTALTGHEVWRTQELRRQPLLANADAVEEDGEPREIVHSLRDITRIKQADEAKTMFLATASHELKTPLTVMMGFADYLMREPAATPLQREAADAIHRRALQLARIVERLLLSSRIEAGRVELTLREVNVEPLAVERARALSATTDRSVDVTVDDGGTRDAGLVCIGDEHALATVIDHLLDNAVKYSPEGASIAVAISSPAGSVDVSVTDLGIGMGAEETARCFDKFWQAQQGDVRSYGGTGIGLYIVRSLVEAMGGTITVVSRLGAGSTFTVSLPASAPAATTPAAGPAEDGVGERSSIREFMRQIGVPTRETT